MKCCILENSSEDLKKIKNIILEDNYLVNQLDILSFSSSDQINISKDGFDILLLDIELSNENGIDFAEKYININPNSKIIFISSHSELVFDSFKVHPYSFVRKENINIELKNTLTNLVDLLIENKSDLVLKNKEQTIIINQYNISYIESLNHACYIHTTNDIEPIKTRMSMHKLAKELSFYFYRINRSYIINLNEIKIIRNGKIILKNNLEISIQRGQIKKFQKEYDSFLCKKTII